MPQKLYELILKFNKNERQQNESVLLQAENVNLQWEQEQPQPFK